MQIIQGQFALIKLSLGKSAIDQTLNQSLDTRRGRVCQCPRSCFEHIRQHDQAGFLCLGAGPWISKVIYAYGLVSPYFFGLLVKKRNHTGTVMLTDRVNDRLAEFVFFGDLDSFLYVRYQNSFRHGRGQLIVFV